MHYVFYYLTVHYYNSKVFGDCPVHYFMKKYGFNDFLPIPKSNIYRKNSYLICIPKVINKEFTNILKSEGCHFTYLDCQEIEEVDLNNKMVDEKSIWNGCYYENIFYIKEISKTIDV